MTDNTAMDNLPDVDVRLKVPPAPDPRIAAPVTGRAHCRFCIGAEKHSDDVRTLIKWAEEHEASAEHAETKSEVQGSVPIAPEDEGDRGIGRGTGRPLMDAPWGPDNID